MSLNKIQKAMLDTDVQAEFNKVGDLTTLSTTQKGSLVGAVNETVSQLAEKAKQTDLDTTNNTVALKADKNDVRLVSIKLGQTDMTSEFLQQMAGTTPINAVPALNSITTDQLAFLKRSKNLFNKNRSTAGYSVSSYTGELVANASFNASDYILVEPSVAYAINNVYAYAFYDLNKVYISGGNTSPLTTPSNAKFIRISVASNKLGTTQLEKGSVSTTFEAFYEVVSLENQEKQPITVLDLPSIPASKLSIISKSTNLFNKNDPDVAIDYLVSSSTGSLTSSAGFVTTGFIPVTSLDSYTIKTLRRYVCYDSNKAFVSSKLYSVAEYDKTIQIPSGVSYIRFSWYPVNDVTTIDTQQVNNGDFILPYESFGEYISSEYLPNGQQEQEIVFNLPPKIYGLVGKEVNIYFDNLINTKDTDYDFDVVCSIGSNFGNFFRVTPSTAGTFAITIKMLKGVDVIATATSSIIVKSASVGTGINKNVLVIGDSTTAQLDGKVIQKLAENFSTDVMNITFVGTQGIEPYKHEGKSGWKTSQHYSSVDSSFVFNGVFDFSQYITSNALSTPDYVVLNLGINDVFNLTDDASVLSKASEMISQYESMISSIKTQNASVKIGVAVTIPPNYYQDAFGYSYANGQIRNRYKLSNMLLVRELIQSFKGREAENIFLVPINVNLDTRNNMGTQEVQVNARNPKLITMPTANGAVHPDEYGFHQIADIYWYWLKSFEV